MTLSNPCASPILRVPKDNTGTVIIGRFKDDSGNIIDLSAATGDKLFHCSQRDGSAVTTDGAASFTTDGTDGKVQFTLTATEVGTVQELRCEFEVQGLSGGNRISEQFILKIIERAKGA